MQTDAQQREDLRRAADRICRQCRNLHKDACEICHRDVFNPHEVRSLLADLDAVRVRGLPVLIDMLSDDSPCNHCPADIGDNCRPRTPGCRTALLTHFGPAPEKTARTDPQPFRGLHFDKDKLRAMSGESDASEPEGGEPRE